MSANGSRKLVEDAHAEVERRMDATVEEVLKAEWPAYAAALAHETEWPEIIRDVTSTARLNKPDLLAEYLTVMAEERFKVPANPEASLASAHKLIDARREIEIEVLGNMPVPEVQMPPEPTGFVATTWRWVSRTVAGIAALLFGSLGIATLVDPGPAIKTIGERLAIGLGLVAFAAALVFAFFFSRRTKESINRWVFRRAMRRSVEEMYRRK